MIYKQRVKSKGVYLIAEAGINHNGDVNAAFELIRAAAEAGADAIKFQTFDSEKLVSKNLEKAKYQVNASEKTETQLEMLKRLELPKSCYFDLQEYSKLKNIDFLSTAFDIDSLEFLLSLNMPVLKISSGELINGPLLWRFGRSGKPLILSTGMCTQSEVKFALATLAHSFQNDTEPQSIDEIWSCWNDLHLQELIVKNVTLLHCTSQYPAPYESVNLKAMNTLSDVFKTRIGYSDHTEGILISLAAVALGATVIEKHFTLDKSLPGPDQKVSLDVLEFSELSRQIRILELALGSGEKMVQDGEWELRKLSRQSLIAAKPIKAGSILMREDFTTARVGCGREPNCLWDFLGAVAKKSYLAGDPIDE